jgi:diguanylate cyclase (GGDEF)-like protein
MDSQPFSVLLVSEDRGLLRCLQKLLRICGCEVWQVGALRRAPAALASVSPDFLILDAHAGLDDALEISRSQSARRARGEIYTLLLAHAPGVNEIYKALEAGVDDFLANPVVYCELLARLRAGARELELERRLGEHSGVDSLTGLPNRRALESRLQRQLSAGIGKTSLEVCVLMEVDFFHRVDHQFGRQAGETVLRDVAARLLELTGETAFLASLGGGQFAFLPSKVADEEATAWAECLRSDWADSEIRFGDDCLKFTASFGVASPAGDGSITAGELLRRGAEALDLARASGGDCVLHYGQFDDKDEAWSSFAAPGKLFEGAVARDVMTPLPGMLRTDELASEAVNLLRRCRLAALPAVDQDGKLLGIVSEDGIAEDLSGRPAGNSTVGQVMKREVVCLDEEASFAEIIESFAQDAATPIVITHDGRPTGLAMPENLVVLGRKLTKDNLAATVPYSPLSDYLVVPDLCPAETA